MHDEEARPKQEYVHMIGERCAYVDAKWGLKHAAQRRPFPGALGLKLYKIVSVLPAECTTDSELYGQIAR